VSAPVAEEGRPRFPWCGGCAGVLVQAFVVVLVVLVVVAVS